MNLKKIIAGICSMALLTSGSMLNASAAPGGRNRDTQETTETQLPDNFAGYMGDLDSDVSVGITDIIIMQKYLLGTQTITQDQAWYADMNQDNLINIYDLILLKKAVLNHDWTMVVYDEPIEETTTEPETTEPETPEPTSEETTEPTSDPVENTNFITAPISKIGTSLPSQGEARLVIFYVDFPDCQYDYSPTAEEIQKIAFGDEDTSNENYPFDSMTAFYSRSSKGSMHLSGQAFRYTAKENISVYSQDKNKLVQECYEAFKDSVDFSQFDGNNDGRIDATLISVPTTDDEWGGDWWPCAGAAGMDSYQIDGKTVSHLITGNAQIASASNYGNFNSSYLHEMGHCMGLPDYYLYYSPDDGEGFHGETNTAGVELMDMDASTDFGCFSKLMLGWYRENQISVYDQSAGGEQTFTLNNAQTDDGNCLILPYGDANYNGEYLILEYMTSDRNNSNAVYTPWITAGNGIRAYHVKAEIADNGWWKFFKYENGSEYTNNDDNGIRLIRLVNDAEGGDTFKTGDTLDGSISGWHWYASDESESVDTGYTVKVGENANGQYVVTVSKN